MSSVLGPEAVEWRGAHYRTLLNSAESGGAISVVDTVTPPDAGPPRHIHADADETFVLLSGDCEFWLEGERFFRGPGEAAFVPRGQEHTFRVTGDNPGRHLVILTPGGFEGFFHAMAAGKYEIPEDMEKIAEIAATFHLTFTGPPLGE